MKHFIMMLCTIILVAGVLTDSSAQSPVGFNGIGGQVGFVKPSDVNSTFGVGVNADLGNPIQSLRLYPGIEYWSKSSGPASFSQFSINADARYYFNSGGKAAAYAGAGLALLFSSSEVEILGVTTGVVYLLGK